MEARDWFKVQVKYVCRVVRGVRSFVSPVDFWQMKSIPISRALSEVIVHY